MNELDPLTFRFRWMDEGNVAGGMFALTGTFDGKHLKLDEEVFPVSSIMGSAVAENVLSVVVDEEGEWRDLTFVVVGEKPDAIKRAIDGSRSEYEIAQEQKQLVELGQGESFRSVQCPHCGAVISLSKFADTPQCYCDYCETLFTIPGQFGIRDLGTKTLDQSLETKYRLCDECGMYSFPRKFTKFYFIFLVYFIHFASDSTVRCPGCMRWEAWKMVFGNLFGFLGLPVAFTQLFRSYRGRIESGPLKGLDDANILANRGKIDRALDRYDALMDNLPINAGIKFNIASGLLAKEDISHAESMFLLSLEDCSNYGPSLNGLRHCYIALDKKEHLQQLEYQMGIDGQMIMKEPEEEAEDS